MCEVEGTEQEVLDTNLNSCPRCHALTKNTPKLLAHITSHVLFDAMVNHSSELCGLCLKPSPQCQWILHMNKGSVRVDFVKMTCARISRFSYGPASTPTQTNPCGNVPVRCTHCPKGLSTVWKYNMEAHYHAKHSPTLPPAELRITNFELEGLKALWDSRHTANHTETRHWKQHRPNFKISEAHSS